jgi:hypothetical protein
MTERKTSQEQIDFYVARLNAVCNAALDRIQTLPKSLGEWEFNFGTSRNDAFVIRPQAQTIRMSAFFATRMSYEVVMQYTDRCCDLIRERSSTCAKRAAMFEVA